MCPPSSATHPRDRWETAFVYAFVKKFIANGKDKTQIQGFECPMEYVAPLLAACPWFVWVLITTDSLEAALLSSQPEPVLEQILAKFVKNLRPKKGAGP